MDNSNLGTPVVAHATTTPPSVPVVATPVHVSWGAVLAGTVVSIGSWLLLHLVGMAVGLTAVESDEPGSLRAIGIGTGIWTVIAPLIALFLGGIVTARLTGLLSRPLGAIHGAVMWATTMILGTFFLFNLVGAVVGKVTQVGGAAVSSAAEAATGAAGASGGILSALGIDEHDLVAPINERLRQQGKPTITADQLEAALKDASSSLVRTGELDREQLVDSLASKTALSRQDAQEVAAQIDQKVRATGTDLEARARSFGTEVQEQALGAADTTGKVLGWTSLALALGLAAAIGGALLGAGGRRLTHVPPRARVHVD